MSFLIIYFLAPVLFQNHSPPPPLPPPSPHPNFNPLIIKKLPTAPCLKIVTQNIFKKRQLKIEVQREDVTGNSIEQSLGFVLNQGKKKKRKNRRSIQKKEDQLKWPAERQQTTTLLGMAITFIRKTCFVLIFFSNNSILQTLCKNCSCYFDISKLFIFNPSFSKN